MDMQLSRTIARPPADVFRFVGTDHLENHPTWDPGIESLTARTPGPMGLGTELALVRKSMGMRQAMTMTFTAFKPNSQFGFHGDSKQVDVDVAMTIEPAGDDASNLTMSVHAEPKGVAKLMAPMISSQMRKEVTKALNRIKKQLEGHK
jgi:carbon monoxide dehydrogenase subunit G